jgi:hypothetical protein
MKRIITLGAAALLSAGVAFGAVVGVASAIDGDTTSSTSSTARGQQEVTPDEDAVRRMAVQDQIPVVDSTGKVRGTVEKTDLFDEKGQARAYSMLVPVHDDGGAVVGYFSNLGGFVEKDTAEQPGFDPVKYASERGQLPSSSVDQDPPLPIGK